MRKALIVGIDYYTNVSPLFGCVNDSFGVKTMLERHADGSVNFGVKHLAATGPTELEKKGSGLILHYNLKLCYFFFMPRPIRIEYEDAYYHVINRGRNHESIFHSKEYYQAFLKTLEEAHRRFGVQILC